MKREFGFSGGAGVGLALAALMVGLVLASGLFLLRESDTGGPAVLPFQFTVPAMPPPHGARQPHTEHFHGKAARVARNLRPHRGRKT